MKEGPDTTSSERAEYTLREKLGFFVWGVRYLDVLILMAYPTMGAVFAIQELALDVLARFAVFSVFNFIFLTHMYVFNDWSDARLNPEEPKRRPRHALKRPVFASNQVLAISLIMSAVALIGFWFLSWRLFAVALFIVACTASYSHPRINLKGRPVVSTLIHFTCAVLYFMGGWAVFMPVSMKGICLAVFFGLVLAAGHFSNEIEDFEHDMAAGIRTNAIAFGQRMVFRAGIVLFILSSIFFIYIIWIHILPSLWVSTKYSPYNYEHVIILYKLIAGGLLMVWCVQAWRYRQWKGGDPIHGFRNYYRALYAAFCASLIIIRLYEIFISSFIYYYHDKLSVF